MKITKTLSIAGLLLVLNSCNEDVESSYIFDVYYSNRSDQNIKIVSYFEGQISDIITIKSNGKLKYNNICGEASTLKGYNNKPFRVIKDEVIRDSILILVDVVDADFKKYIKLEDSLNLNKTIYPKMGRLSYAVNLFNYKFNKSQIEFLPSKRGYYRNEIIFEEIDFKKTLKMYDYEKRGL
jgi:hypothetical protein